MHRRSPINSQNVLSARGALPALADLRNYCQGGEGLAFFAGALRCAAGSAYVRYSVHDAH